MVSNPNFIQIVKFSDTFLGCRVAHVCSLKKANTFSTGKKSSFALSFSTLGVSKIVVVLKCLKYFQNISKTFLKQFESPNRRREALEAGPKELFGGARSGIQSLLRLPHKITFWFAGGFIEPGVCFQVANILGKGVAYSWQREVQY